jgi:hypothetical protein
MSDVINKLAEAGHLTPEQIDRIGENVHELVKAAKDDPALLEAYLEKTAGIGDFASSVGKYMQQAAPAIVGGTLLTAGIAAGTGVLGQAYDSIKNSVTKARSYKDMLDKNPQLANYNAEAVQGAFNTLHRFNPEYAGDPLVAGTFVRNAAEQERVDVQQIHGLLQARERSMKIQQGGRSISPQDMVKQPIWTPKQEDVKAESTESRAKAEALGRAGAKQQLQSNQRDQSLAAAHGAFKR